MYLQKNSRATVSHCSISGVGVEEVNGNVLMTFCDCDNCATVGFWGNAVMAAVGESIGQCEKDIIVIGSGRGRLESVYVCYSLVGHISSNV